MNRLDVTYRSVARPWHTDELAEHYQAADLRGASDLPPDEEPPDRPVILLATAVPRLISLAVAANVLHILPRTASVQPPLSDELFSTFDLTAAGSLHRCHLALQADGRSRHYPVAEWLPLVYEEAAHALDAFSPTADPPSLIEHAQQAGRYTAIAIGSLDRDAPTVPETISDCLAHLLTICVFADHATGRHTA